MKTNLIQKLIIVFWKQNKRYNHGVLFYSLKVTWGIVKNGKFKMETAGLLHDI